MKLLSLAAALLTTVYAFNDAPSAPQKSVKDLIDDFNLKGKGEPTLPSNHLDLEIPYGTVREMINSLRHAATAKPKKNQTLPSRERVEELIAYFKSLQNLIDNKADLLVNAPSYELIIELIEYWGFVTGNVDWSKESAGDFITINLADSTRKLIHFILLSVP
jgi:hypothetical protein